MLFALIGLGLLMVNAVLMLSDRAPGALRRLSDRLDTRGSRAAQAARRVAADSSFLDAAIAIHIAAWAAATIAVGIVVWSWRGLVTVAIGMFALSVVVEASQQFLTDTRTVTSRDVVGNGVGVGLGVVCVAVCYLMWSAAHAMSPRRRR